MHASSANISIYVAHIPKSRFYIAKNGHSIILGSCGTSQRVESGQSSNHLKTLEQKLLQSARQNNKWIWWEQFCSSWTIFIGAILLFIFYRSNSAPHGNVFLWDHTLSHADRSIFCSSVLRWFVALPWFHSLPWRPWAGCTIGPSANIWMRGFWVQSRRTSPRARGMGGSAQ